MYDNRNVIIKYALLIWGWGAGHCGSCCALFTAVLEMFESDTNLPKWAMLVVMEKQWNLSLIAIFGVVEALIMLHSRFGASVVLADVGGRVAYHRIRETQPL